MEQEGNILNGKTTVFTPTVLTQIKNLVERGKSREEIAEILGTTPGSLAGTCSKLGISLRRPSGVVMRKPRAVAATETIAAPVEPNPTSPGPANGIPELLRVERALQESIRKHLKAVEVIKHQLDGVAMARKALQRIPN